ncbi:MAG TPA: TIGR00266 family protein [bacterium]|nr:TIGR00266 family protein [bacterium]
MRYEIIGDNLQFVKIYLSEGEEVYAEAGKMMFKSANVSMESKLVGKPGENVITGALKRVIAGESIFTTHFKAVSGEGVVAFAGDYPGRIEPIVLDDGKSFIAQRDAFICAQISVEFSIAFQKHIGVALFGGEGFILEKFNGPGVVFIHGGGDFYIKELAPGEKLQVDTGCIVGFDDTVSYEINFVKDVKTALFGGEGIFLANLVGPGKVILQSLTLARLRREIGGIRRFGKGGEKFGLGGLLGGIFGSED